jgi:hypothetical protein
MEETIHNETNIKIINKDRVCALGFSLFLQDPHFFVSRKGNRVLTISLGSAVHGLAGKSSSLARSWLSNVVETTFC